MARTDVKANVPVTIQIDLEQLLSSSKRWTEDGPEAVYSEIIDAAAQQVAASMYRDATEYRDRIRDAIDAKLNDLITEALDARFQPTNAMGDPKGSPTSLREMIARQADEWLKSASQADRSYGSGASGLKKYIGEAVDRSLKAELDKSLQAAKAEVVKRVRENAAAVIADTITRSAVR